MVSLGGVAPATGLLELTLDALERAALRTDGAERHVRAYVGWVLGGQSASSLDLTDVVTSTASLDGAARTYRDVAALGLAIAAGYGGTAQRDRLRDGIAWLAGRSYLVPNRPPGLEADAIALVGLAAGIRALDQSGERDRLASWLRALLRDVEAHAMLGTSWEAGFVRAAELLLGERPGEAVARTHMAPDLATALAAHGLTLVTPEEEVAAEAAIMSLTFRDHAPERAATQLAALRWLLRALPRALPRRATVADVVDVLDGVKRSVRRWTWEEQPRTKGGELVRWPIKNEYHVQNLLWVVLAPIFPDLEDEENLPSLGQKHPRADLGIPSLKLVVEAKFIYKGTTSEFGRIIEEVAADASLYATEASAYSAILPFVWDDSGRAEEHAELIQGLERISGVIGTIVIARPGKMR